MGKSLNFLNQVGTLRLAQHPFGDTGSQFPPEGFLPPPPAPSPSRAERAARAPGRLPPASRGPGRRSSLGPPAIPQQGSLPGLAGAPGLPLRLFKALSHAFRGFTRRPKAAESRAAASTPALQSRRAAPLPGCGNCCSSSPAPRGAAPCPAQTAPPLGRGAPAQAPGVPAPREPQPPGHMDTRASHYRHDAVRPVLELRCQKPTETASLTGKMAGGRGQCQERDKEEVPLEQVTKISRRSPGRLPSGGPPPANTRRGDGGTWVAGAWETGRGPKCSQPPGPGPSRAGKGLEHHRLWRTRSLAGSDSLFCASVPRLQRGHKTRIFFMGFP